MTLIECESTREIPSRPFEMYALGKGETVEDVIRQFKARFHAEPTVGYKWGSYVYMVRPE